MKEILKQNKNHSKIPTSPESSLSYKVTLPSCFSLSPQLLQNNNLIISIFIKFSTHFFPNSLQSVLCGYIRFLARVFLQVTIDS